jgi:hypothetical protein
MMQDFAMVLVTTCWCIHVRLLPRNTVCKVPAAGAQPDFAQKLCSACSACPCSNSNDVLTFVACLAPHILDVPCLPGFFHHPTTAAGE